MSNGQMRSVWVPGYPADARDRHAGFRASVPAAANAGLEIRISASGWFNLWVDGSFVGDGPTRHAKDFPEQQVFHCAGGAGLLAVEVQDFGDGTQRHPFIPPFLACEAYREGRPVPMGWKSILLAGHQPGAMRMGPGHAYADWCDLRELPMGWREGGFDDSAWQTPEVVDRFAGTWAAPSDLGVQQIPFSPRQIGGGRFAHTYCWGPDEQALQFYLRELENLRHPADGVWRRYDLGRVRLGRPDFVIDAPAGSIVEFGYSEHLRNGRVSPFFGYRGGPTCNMDHYVAPGGPCRYFPSVPKGGRFIEVHVFAPEQEVRFLGESYIERVYFGEPGGALDCGEPLLNRIWTTGIETLRACSEDAVTDCPTRERGQYVGDTLSVGMEIARVAWNDLSLFRRALVQAAQCARADGLVAGCSPGWTLYLPTYSLQWITAAVRYHELTGDRGILEELHPAGRANLACFDRFWTDAGLTGSQAMDESGMGWVFIDWGYALSPGTTDMGLNLHYLMGLRSFLRWCTLIGADPGGTPARAEAVESLCSAWLEPRAAAGDWRGIGYHKAVLSLAAGLVPPPAVDACVSSIKAHIENCFPNDPEAPRLGHIGVKEERVITPYFFHFVAPLLIRHGAFDFVLGQFRRCWGWMLDQGVSTWMEVFDDRWSHCHHWSGCPTWQLSHFMLGLNRRFDLGPRHYEFCFREPPLPQASGHLPEGIAISWHRDDGSIAYRIETESPIVLHGAPGSPTPIPIEGIWETNLPARLKKL